MRYNVLKSCATRVCCACGDPPICVAVMYLTLRTGCERHGRKNPLPYSFSKRSHVGNLRQIRKQGKGRSPKRKGNRRCPFLFAPAAGRGTFPPSADGESLAEPQRKTCRPDRVNRLRGSSAPLSRCREGAARQGRIRLRQFEHPAGSVQRKEPPVRGEPACGSSCAPVSRCRKGAARRAVQEKVPLYRNKKLT